MIEQQQSSNLPKFLPKIDWGEHARQQPLFSSDCQSIELRQPRPEASSAHKSHENRYSEPASERLPPIDIQVELVDMEE